MESQKEISRRSLFGLFKVWVGGGIAYQVRLRTYGVLFSSLGGMGYLFSDKAEKDARSKLMERAAGALDTAYSFASLIIEERLGIAGFNREALLKLLSSKGNISLIEVLSKTAGKITMANKGRIENIYAYVPISAEAELKNLLMQDVANLVKSLENIKWHRNLGVKAASPEFADQLEAKRESNLFFFWELFLTDDRIPSPANEQIEKAITQVINRVAPLTVDTSFLGNRPVLIVLMDSTWDGKESYIGREYYKFPDDGGMPKAATAAYRNEEGTFEDPFPGDNMFYPDEVPSMGFYKAKKGILWGVDVPADAYYKSQRDTRKKVWGVVGFATAVGVPVIELWNRNLISRIKKIEPVIAAFSGGDLEFDTTSLEEIALQKDEIGGMARTLRQLSVVNKEIIASMIDPNALRMIIKKWDKPDELYGLRELNTAILYTDTYESTTLSKLISTEAFSDLLSYTSLCTQRALAIYGLRTHYIPGDGEIVIESEANEKGGKDSAAMRVMLAAVEGYRQVYAVNYVLKKLGCLTFDKRFGLHYGKIYAGLQRYNDDYLLLKHPLPGMIREILTCDEMPLEPEQKERLKSITKAIIGEAMNVASLYEPAGKHFTNFTISPELFHEIRPYIDEFEGKIEAIGELRKAMVKTNGVSVHDILIKKTDIEGKIDGIFKKNSDLAERVKAAIQKADERLFVEKAGFWERKDEAAYGKKVSDNLATVKFKGLAYWKTN